MEQKGGERNKLIRKGWLFRIPVLVLTWVWARM